MMYHQPIEQVLASLKSSAQHGLSADDARLRLSQFGPNEIEQSKGIPLFTLILRQFKSPIVFLLLFAALLSFVYSKWGDGIAVLGVLLINACIGFFMEFKAERSMNALRRLTKSFSKVIRDGSLTQIPTAEIVPGDILFVEAGDVISADARIIASFQLQVNESAMTGESLHVEKYESTLSSDTLLADRTNMLHKGTFVSRGNARGLVTATGMETELGKIASLVQSSQDSTTPIEKKLEQFSKKLIWITLMIGVGIFFIGIANGRNIPEMLNTVIALSVAAIPEGLPIVATLALAHGMMKMARRNVIVKKLASVETLGGTNVICTDKTGTLTYNQIRVSSITTQDFCSSDSTSDTRSAQLILKACVLCNNAQLLGNDDGVGDPLEVGLLQFALDRKLNIGQVRTDFQKILEEPFSSETKVMATLHSSGHEKILFAKGAAEEIVRSCSYYLDGNTTKDFTPELKDRWLRRAENEASTGQKVLAFAGKWDEQADDSIQLTALTFLGIASLMDPPRTDVTEAITDCQKAGIRVVMITGDHPSTAKNIADQIGITSKINTRVIQGSDMKQYAALTDDAKREWRNTAVFARVSPAQKLDLIQVLQEDHSIVAMTGDGVNDAPALRKADIGIAMGLRGTDVAKEVADMVLKDDSFLSIVAAIREGRIIFENIRKFLMFLLSSNLSEILVIAALFLTNSPITIVPLQILFINLLSDVFPALALGFSKGSDTILQRPPRDPKKPVLNNRQWMSVIVYAVIIAASTYSTSFLILTENENIPQAATVLFYTLILSQLLHVFSVGDHREIFYKSDVFRNPYVWAGIGISGLLAVVAYFIGPVKEVLYLAELDLRSIGVILACGSASFLFIQVLKRMNLIH